MIFLSLVVVLAIVYWLGSARFIQYDGWFIHLVRYLQSSPMLASTPILPLVFALLLPMLILVIAIVLIAQLASAAWLFFIYVPVLLYSLGRCNFIAEVKQYIAICTRGDNVAASKFVEDLRGNVELGEQADVSDWTGLHTQALKVIAYRGFECTFAVLFWFFIAGPVGALLYRLSILYREISTPGGDNARVATKWLWLLEFPAARLMGVTWGLVGNFDTCPLRHSLIDTESSSVVILNNCLRGALGAPTDCMVSKPVSAQTDGMGNTTDINEESQDIIEDLTGAVITTHTEPAYSFALVKSSLPLYSRALLFWVCAIAFATLVV